jgi:hypothetical protein
VKNIKPFTLYNHLPWWLGAIVLIGKLIDGYLY